MLFNSARGQNSTNHRAVRGSCYPVLPVYVDQMKNRNARVIGLGYEKDKEA